MQSVKEKEPQTIKINSKGKIKKVKGNKIIKVTASKLNYKLKQEIKIKYRNEQSKYINSVGIVSRTYNINNKKYYLIIDLYNHNDFGIECEDNNIIPEDVRRKFDTIMLNVKMMIKQGLIYYLIKLSF